MEKIEDIIKKEYLECIAPISLRHILGRVEGTKIDYGEIRELQERFKEKIKWINNNADNGKIIFNAEFTIEYLRAMDAKLDALDLQEEEDLNKVYGMLSYLGISQSERKADGKNCEGGVCNEKNKEKRRLDEEDIEDVLTSEFKRFIMPIRTWHEQFSYGEKVNYELIRESQRKFQERLEWINLIAETGEIRFSEHYSKEYIEKMAEDFKKLDLQQPEDVIKAYGWYYRPMRTPYVDDHFRGKVWKEAVSEMKFSLRSRTLI